MSQAKPRFAIDLDEIERQLAAPQRPVAPPADPLAELARIVGQDDPFRKNGAPRTAQAPQDYAPPAHDRSERYAEDLDAATAYPQAHAGWDHEPQAQHYDGRHAAYADERDYAEAEEELDDLPPPAQRSAIRKGALAIGALLGVAAIGVTGVFVMGGGSTPSRDGPLLVKADNEPLKVQPQNPGGLEIPNQNKEIYERSDANTKTQVVNREEQPLDVREAARSLPPPATALVPPAGASSAGPNPTVTAALGEPRRVRTVTVKPDGTIIAPQGGTASAPAAAASLVSAPPPRPVAAVPVAPAAPSAPPPAAAPVATAARPPAPAAPRASEAMPSGTYAVQIAVSTSEAEARNAFRGLQQKYSSDLGNLAPVIRSAEVNGKTVFRVRVGPMSKDDAGSLCTRLKGNGGACFVARN